MSDSMEVTAKITKPEKEPWEVYDVRANTSGVYFVLTVRSKGGPSVPVTVKHSTRHDTMVCLTCLTNDQCQHSKFIRAHVRNHPEQLSA